MNEYAKFLQRLESMDIAQIKEMLHDLESIKVVYKLQQAIDDFIESYVEKEDDVHGGMPDFDDWKHADDSQRYRDIQS